MCELSVSWRLRRKVGVRCGGGTSSWVGTDPEQRGVWGTDPCSQSTYNLTPQKLQWSLGHPWGWVLGPPQTPESGVLESLQRRPPHPQTPSRGPKTAGCVWRKSAQRLRPTCCRGPLPSEFAASGHSGVYSPFCRRRSSHRRQACARRDPAAAVSPAGRRAARVSLHSVEGSLRRGQGLGERVRGQRQLRVQKRPLGGDCLRLARAPARPEGPNIHESVCV